jgi:hypothetical protein
MTSRMLFSINMHPIENVDKRVLDSCIAAQVNFALPSKCIRVRAGRATERWFNGPRDGVRWRCREARRPSEDGV